MKTKTLTKIATAFAVTAVLFTACKKEEKATPATPPPPANESEQITTMELTFTDTANPASVFTAIFNDPDGDGGNAPTQFDTIKLNKGRVYNVEVLLLDKSKTPVDTISNEVEEEANEHMFFFKFTGAPVSSIGFAYKDMDTNTPPIAIGLKSQWTIPNTAGTGTAQVILKHQPGVKNGTETPGDTDIDVTFQTKIN